MPTVLNSADRSIGVPEPGLHRGQEARLVGGRDRRSQNARRVGLIRGDELRPKRVYIFAGVALEQRRLVGAEADILAQLGHEAAVVVQLTPAQKRRRGLVGIMVSSAFNIDARVEMLRLELDPAGVVGDAFHQPDRVIGRIRLDDMGSLMDGQASVIGMGAAPGGVDGHHAAAGRGNSGDVRPGLVDDIDGVRRDELVREYSSAAVSSHDCSICFSAVADQTARSGACEMSTKPRPGPSWTWAILTGEFTVISRITNADTF